MAAFTSKATGNWSSSGQTTWNQVGVPGSGDTVTITHAITVDVNTTTGGGSFTANLTVAPGVTFTIAGAMTHNGCEFIQGAGSAVVFSTAGGSRVWTLVNHAKYTINGTVGSKDATISKTGSNWAYFDCAGGGSDRPEWNLRNFTITGIGKSDFSSSLTAVNMGGDYSVYLLNGTFDNCGTVFGDLTSGSWDPTVASDYRVEDVLFLNSPGVNSINVRSSIAGFGDGITGGGLKTLKRCSFSGFVDGLRWHGFKVEDNYFGKVSTSLYAVETFRGNMMVLNTNSDTFNPITGIKDFYLLADFVDPADRINGVTGVGNPHFIIASGSTPYVYDGVILEYPHYASIDTGDGFLGVPAGSTIKNSISLPAVADGNPSASLYSLTAADANVKIEHNTVVGLFCQLVFNENNPTGQVIPMQSNLVVSTGSSPNFAYAMYDIFSSPTSVLDLAVPHAIKYNHLYNAGAVNDPSTGLPHDGFNCRMSSLPDGTNALHGGDPAFVDTTRNVLTWGVAQGVIASADFTVNANRRAGLDDVRTYLLSNPTKVAHLIRWVRAGFLPLNTALYNAGHDQKTIGAVYDDPIAQPTYGSIPTPARAFAAGLL